ncbi:MAG: hypothetical protein HOG18_00305 [Proteobacteria bacterium]|jgi:hypothetical protein|nr:hypothetical protein [Pseudomonadota bacterium]MDB4825270.1 hypothetical protein [Gammaproteobacteria bacterium]MBT4988088.1 hypothetical protein [Pseudomonadota bacterium]MBT5190467.1 hypothetical protein [Pseudomonadota bacterium]MBT5624594.1 hypothetical protein [Pseudomonadota bacterium]
MTQTRKINLLIVLSLLMTLTSIGYAQNALFLRNSVIAELAASDLDSLLEAISEKLDDDVSTESSTWISESGDTTSTLIVTSDYKKNDLDCRGLEIDTIQQSQRVVTNYGFCNVDGNWLMDAQ